MAAQIIGNSIIIGSIYALIAFGFTLMYSTMNFFNMAYGTNVMVGAYAFYICYGILDMPIIPSAVLACVFTVLFILLLDRLCYYPMRQKRVPGWVLVVISMSVAIILESVMAMVFGSKTIHVYKGFPEGYRIFGAYVTGIQLAVLLAAVVIMIITTVFLRRTKTGTIIRALANDKQMATVIGIDVEHMYVIIIIVSTLLSTSAGIFQALDTDIRPRMGGPIMLKAITCSIIGGVGNIRGALVAAFVLGLLENVVTLYIGSGWRDAISLLVLVVLMLIKPSAFGIKQNA